MTLERFIEKISAAIAGITASDLLVDGKRTHFEVALGRKLRMEDLAEELIDILSERSAREFFGQTEDSDLPLNLHFIQYLFGLIPRNCAIAAGGVTFDSASALKQLKEFAECVRTRQVPYTISLRLSGLDIDGEFELGDGVVVRKITLKELDTKYPIVDGLFSLGAKQAESSRQSRVEAVAKRTGAPAMVPASAAYSDKLVDLIQHALVIAKITKTSMRVSHVNIDSPLESSTLLNSIPIADKPKKLSADDIAALQRAFALLSNTDSDRVLETSIDRYILARKQPLHHPNESNRPHWDKIVDYVIALESLFLTVEGNPASQELSYRFSLNGAAVLSAIDSHEPLVIFDALKIAYQMRSKVVHGSDEKTVTKAATSFLNLLKVSHDSKNTMNCLLKICNQLEDWTRSLFYRFQQMDVSERPYRKKHGWEALVFGVNASLDTPGGSRLPPG